MALCVWYDMLRYGRLWYGTIWCAVLGYGIPWYVMMRYVVACCVVPGDVRLGYDTWCYEMTSYVMI